jgi:hypothetical protein
MFSCIKSEFGLVKILPPALSLSLSTLLWNDTFASGLRRFPESSVYFFLIEMIEIDKGGIGQASREVVLLPILLLDRVTVNFECLPTWKNRNREL